MCWTFRFTLGKNLKINYGSPFYTGQVLLLYIVSTWDYIQICIKLIISGLSTLPNGRQKGMKCKNHPSHLSYGIIAITKILYNTVATVLYLVSSSDQRDKLFCGNSKIQNTNKPLVKSSAVQPKNNDNHQS